MPGGDMAWFYKGSPGIQLNFSRVLTDRRGVYPGLGFSLGYSKFKPKADTLYFLIEDQFGSTGYGTAAYKDQTTIQLTVSYFWVFPIVQDRIEFLLGAELGYYYTHFEYYLDNDQQSTYGEEIDSNIALVPFASVGFNVTDHIRIAPYFKYNFVVSTSGSDWASIYFDTTIDYFQYFYSAGVSVGYTF